MKQISILLLLMIAVSPVFSQKKDKAAKEKEYRELIESRQYRFIARTALPMEGKSISLTSEYDLVVDSMQIKSFLPFYGRAYSVNYGQTDGGIKFDRQADDYSAEFKEKKKKFLIKIKVKDKNDSYVLTLDAGISGYAHLSISSNNKQNMSFYGIIDKIDEP